MRAPLVFVVLAIGFLAPLASQARADEIPPGELGLLLGITRLDRDVVGPGRHPDYSPVYGMRFGTNMDRRVSYFLEGLYGRFDSMVERKTGIFETRAGVERNFALGRSRSDWYLAGALGYADVNEPGGALGDFGRPLLSTGIGIRGPAILVGAAATENIVALCDVDEERSAQGFAQHPEAKKYKDYRKRMHKNKAIIKIARHLLARINYVLRKQTAYVNNLVAG